MKKLFVSLLLLAQFAFSGTAMATIVDFSVLGTLSSDITTPADFSTNGVTFSYDNFGIAADYAIVDSSGIFGTTNGALILNFAAPATAFNLNFSTFDFVLGGAQTTPIADVLTVLLFNGGMLSDVRSASADFLAHDPTNDPTLGATTGTFAYSGLPFDHASLYFSTDAPFFTVSDVSYGSDSTPAPVPEPATILLTLSGLIGIFGFRKFNFRRTSETA